MKYCESMTTFYRTKPGRRLHLDPECSALFYNGKFKPEDLQAVEAADLTNFNPSCKRCTPPELHTKPKTHHETCSECGPGYPWPCKHNGGVLVVFRGQFGIRRAWRWPENVAGAIIAPEFLEEMSRRSC